MEKEYYAFCCSLSFIGPVKTDLESFLSALGRERRTNTVTYFDGDKVDVKGPVHDYDVYEIVNPDKGLLIGTFNWRGFVPADHQEEVRWEIKPSERRIKRTLEDVENALKQILRNSASFNLYFLHNFLPSNSSYEIEQFLRDDRIKRLVEICNVAVKLRSLEKKFSRFWGSDWKDYLNLVPDATEKDSEYARSDKMFCVLKSLMKEAILILKALQKEATA